VVLDSHFLPTSIRSRKRIIRLFVQFIAFGDCASQKKAKSQSKHWDFPLDDVQHPNARLCVKKPTYADGDELVSNGVLNSHFLPTSIRSRKRIIRLFVQFVACGVCAGQRKAKSQSKHWDFLLDDVEHPNVRLFVKKPTYTNGDELISNGAFDSHFLPSRILSRE